MLKLATLVLTAQFYHINNVVGATQDFAFESIVRNKPLEGCKGLSTLV